MTLPLRNPKTSAASLTTIFPFSASFNIINRFRALKLKISLFHSSILTFSLNN